VSRKRKSRHVEEAPATVEDLSTGVPMEEVLAEGSEEIEAAIVEAVEALADDEPARPPAAAPRPVADASTAMAASDPAPQTSAEPTLVVRPSALHVEPVAAPAPSAPPGSEPRSAPAPPVSG
jgi:hypothetical protein